MARPTNARKKLLELIDKQDKEIDQLMEDTNDYLKRLIVKSSKNNEINKAVIENRVPLLFSFWAITLSSILIRNNKKAVELAGEEAVHLTNRFNKIAISQTIEKTTNKLKESIEKTLFSRRLYDDNKSLGSRIKTIERQYIGTVKDIIRVGIKDGKSARQIASEIDNILAKKEYKTWTSPLDWFRQATGRDLTTARRGGSLEVNTYRIARTEINNTYRLTTVKVHQGKPWIKGFVWHLSPAHAVSCVCEDYDGHVFQTESELPYTHPNCLCYVTPELVNPEEVQ